MRSPFVRTPGAVDRPRRLLPRVPLQRGIIILPSAFTLGNLFFGVYAIVAATRGDFEWAGWFIVFAGILDLLDGRVARFTRTGTAFGAELDSLVDAISFGVAPALIAFQLYFTEGRWGWTVCFVYIAASVVRLARFNVEQAGHAKNHFIGAPLPHRRINPGDLLSVQSHRVFPGLPGRLAVAGIHRHRDGFAGRPSC